MNKQIVFWSGILAAITLWLGWGLRLEPDPVGGMATVLPLVCIALFAAGIWVNASAKHKNSARGFAIVSLGPALMTLIILGTAKFMPSYFDLSVIIAFHIFFIFTGNYVTTSTTWISGFPTFWNVKSPALWSKSQRLFGYGLVLLGLVSLVASLVVGQIYPPVFIIGFVVLFILGNIHSFLLWKKTQTQT